MLAFPSPRWASALNSVSLQQKTSRPSGSRFGRAASLIVSRLYLSDAYTVKNESELVRLGITHVVSILEYTPNIPDLIPQEHKLQITLADRPEADILTHLPSTTDFITSALAEHKENKVLVHCFQGISRSATVVAAYLIASSSMSAMEAIEQVQARRGIVCPNPGFQKQLETYAEAFVRKPQKQGTNKVAKIGDDIAQRIRQLKLSSQQQR
ncbi:hypothetical protein H0H87_006016 [Tephrocybe sp. NHM501043]|nr:hypothetical protein H0H87_006016 [Tephrocybe sp. NHM501043]